MDETPKPQFVIPAEAHTDDRRVEVEFDAIHWFQGASAHEIARLVLCGFGGDYPADEVAQLCAEHNPDLKRLFDYLSIVNAPRSGVCGFECHVNQDAAMEWLKKRELRRPSLDVDADLRYIHTLKDNANTGGTAKVVMEASSSWASIAVWDGAAHIGDVAVELHEGKLVARVWNQDDIEGDPTARVVMCEAPKTQCP